METKFSRLKDDLRGRLRLQDLVKSSGIDLKADGPKNLVGCCPFHNEKTGSFKVNIDEQFYKCFGCGKSGDVFDWIGWTKFKRLDVQGEEFVDVLKDACQTAGIQFPDEQQQSTPADTAPPPQKKAKTIYPTREKLDASAKWQAGEDGGTVADTYDYTNPKTRAIELIVYRIEIPGKGKRFLQAQPCEGGFCFGGKDRNPLFNRTRVASTNCVVVVEGEKCVKALNELSIVATTSPGGSNAGDKADWSPLAGKRIVFWRDNDEAGLKYQETVIAELNKLSPRPKISMVDVDRLPLGPKEDVVDLMARFPYLDQKREAVETIISDARPAGALGELSTVMDDARAGRRFAVPLIWDRLHKATLAFMPGTVSILAGNPGSTKSFAVLQNLAYWQQSGVRAVAYMLEDGAAFHLRRLMAQISGTAMITNDEWVKHNAIESAKIEAATREKLELLEPCIDSPHKKQLTPDDFLQWMTEKVTAGARVLIIDPITLMKKGKFGFNDDFDFMAGAKQIVEDHKASLLLISHPRKQAPGKERNIDLGELAGGVAYERFAQTVMFLESHPERKIVAHNGMTVENATINRTMHVLKARNSWGDWKQFGLWFDKQTLKMREVGEIENP